MKRYSQVEKSPPELVSVAEVVSKLAITVGGLTSFVTLICTTFTPQPPVPSSAVPLIVIG